MSQHELEEVRKKLTNLVEQSIIRPSSSPREAPVLFVLKKDRTLRFCVWYRINECWDSLREAKHFSKIYLMVGYHQIRLDEDIIPETAFKTKYGSFECTVFRTALSMLSLISTMNEIFSDFINKYMIVYLDDILIYSKT